ncbi:hypothetical protein DMA15_12745 [Streptomyces sp. WAC 01529]|uniref:hypothetical protein n=1 Tax=Streptomyces sp. WAC 01529 TaxID=2203205 RepID=UPI000F6B72D6|nr:hypothetical protein [Streptomyces sp. WAC 01529]AZM53344.1 hypothetical protein DMA15_12745 [Streptomyces sp. WAC 01529]
MTADPANVRAAYYVTGAGVEPGQLTGDLTAALDAADEINRAIGTTSSGYGPAFVVPVMAITYPDATAPPAAEPGSSTDGGATSTTHES